MKKKTAAARKRPSAKRAPAKRGAAKRGAAKRANPLAAEELALAKFALGLPEATEDFPWGHRAVKVKGKAFLFMSLDGGLLSLSVKLPQSADFALMQDFAEPTGYGLGKSGWVSSSFPPGKKVPLPLLQEWIRESYRAIAPKKLLALLA